MHRQQRLYPAVSLRVQIRLCPCERRCGGWELFVVESDYADVHPTALGTTYEHLSRHEALDVVDASWEALG